MTKPEGNNEFGKYEKEFSRLMQEAVEKHVEENAEPLNIDYSFLNDRENVKISPVKKRKTARSFARVAVILIVFFCGVSVAMVTDLPTNASAWKAQMARRLYVLKEGFVSSDPDVSVNYIDENTTTIVVDDFGKIEKVKNITPGLPMPRYIPTGYELETFTVDITFGGSYNAIYKFNGKNNNEFSLTIQHDSKVDYSSIVIDYVTETVYTDDRTICLWNDPIEDTYGVTVIEYDYMATIIGSIDNEEMTKIAEKLN